MLDLVDKHHDPTAFERALTMAWTQAQVQLHHLGIDPDEAHLFQLLANHVLYSDPRLRPSPEVLRRNDKGPRLLWTHGISGDLPIVLARIDEAEDLDIVRQLLRAYQYWRLKLLAVDLVILNERAPSYSSDLQDALEALLRANEPQFRQQTNGERPRGGVYVLRSDLVSVEVRTLLRSIARAVLLSRRGSLAEQLKFLDEPEATAAGTTVSTPPSDLLSGERIRRRTPGLVPRNRAAGTDGVLQRSRWLRRTGTGIHGRSRRGKLDAGTLGQHHRQSVVRLPGFCRGRLFNLVAQQPGVSIDPLVERSRGRPPRRGNLHPR